MQVYKHTSSDQCSNHHIEAITVAAVLLLNVPPPPPPVPPTPSNCHFHSLILLHRHRCCSCRQPTATAAVMDSDVCRYRTPLPSPSEHTPRTDTYTCTHIHPHASRCVLAQQKKTRSLHTHTTKQQKQIGRTVSAPISRRIYVSASNVLGGARMTCPERAFAQQNQLEWSLTGRTPSGTGANNRCEASWCCGHLMVPI